LLGRLNVDTIEFLLQNFMEENTYPSFLLLLNQNVGRRKYDLSGYLE